jgi:hypothetical protein
MQTPHCKHDDDVDGGETMSLNCCHILASNFLHAIKSYSMGPKGFTSSPKEGVLLTFITLKIPHLGLV